MLLWTIPLTIGAYLLGSVPTSYIAARLLRKVDLREYGSKAVSGSNLWHAGARWAVVPAGIFDILKGMAPVAIASYVLHLPFWAQGVVGLAAIVGHNWSFYLGFCGGRGLSAMMGALAILAPLELAVFIGLWIAGVLFLRNSPLGAIGGAIAMPLVSLALGEPVELTWCLVAVLLLVIAKRLLPDRGTPITDWRQVVLYRLFLDRDIADRDAWIHRPTSQANEPPEKE
ncbi:MAG: glycerol-3-phosphate acyltransferase [Chloroflexota bacterium]|nr:glycerol-3-phosphate acyltransferase [Chloroflexota bacterium]